MNGLCIGGGGRGRPPCCALVDRNRLQSAAIDDVGHLDHLDHLGLGGGRGAPALPPTPRMVAPRPPCCALVGRNRLQSTAIDDVGHLDHLDHLDHLGIFGGRGAPARQSRTGRAARPWPPRLADVIAMSDEVELTDLNSQPSTLNLERRAAALNPSFRLRRRRLPLV